MNKRIMFLDELNRVRHDILAMSARVGDDLDKAWEALRNNDTALADEVINGDALVNAMQLKIEDQAAALIATQQPVARDLRELVTVFKITGNLERAGDHAVHLARAAVKLRGEAGLSCEERLERMAETGRAMIRSAVDAYLNQDSSAAREVAALDERINAEHRALTAEVLSQMAARPDLVQQAVQILHTSRFLERLGDHITNICEAVVYMVENKHEDL